MVKAKSAREVRLGGLPATDGTWIMLAIWLAAICKGIWRWLNNCPWCVSGFCLRKLCSHRFGVTIKDMMQELGVSEKTIRRDLETFQQVGFPLKEHRWRVWSQDLANRSRQSEPGLSFAFDEAIALYLGRRFLEPLAGTAFWEAAQRAFKKIRATLGPNALQVH